MTNLINPDVLRNTSNEISMVLMWVFIVHLKNLRLGFKSLA